MLQRFYIIPHSHVRHGGNIIPLSILLGKGFWLLLPPRILRNVIMWPIDSLIFFYLAKFMETAGVLRQFGLKPALEKGQKNGGKR